MEELIAHQRGGQSQYQNAEYASMEQNEETHDKSEEKPQQEGVQGFFGKRRR